MEDQVFDKSLPITITSKRIGKTVEVTYPTDEQVLRRDRKVRVIRKRESTDVQGLEAANFELLQAIRTGGDEIDESEASVIIDSIMKSQVEDEGESAGGMVTVKIRTFGGILTEHELRIPSPTEERKHRKSAYAVIDRPYGAREIKTNGSSVADFYELLFKSCGGYKQNSKDYVPISHKVSAVMELLRLINAEDEETDPANFSQTPTVNSTGQKTLASAS